MDGSKHEDFAQHQLGYPINCLPFDGFPANYHYTINNLGDPYVGSGYKLNAFEQERFVVEWFAKLLKMRKKDTWGYITSCGSEGNMRGLVLGRQLYPDAKICYTERSHYSVKNAAKLLGNNFEMKEPNDLLYLIDHPSQPIILCINAGTTFEGIQEDFSEVRGCCNKLYVHVDAALSGLILPFIGESLPQFDSVAISAHKQLGVPVPSGVFLTQKRYLKNELVSYTCSSNNTLFGSRSGLAAILIAQQIQSVSREGLKVWAEDCIRNADYLQVNMPPKYQPHRHGLSTIVTFSKPKAATVRRWQLATEGEWARVCVMPHVTRTILDEFMEDL